MKAFPWLEKIDSTDPTVMNPVSHGGMDLRDYFAAKAMGAYFDGEDAPIDFYFIAQRAYEMADAMMKAREQ